MKNLANRAKFTNDAKQANVVKICIKVNTYAKTAQFAAENINTNANINVSEGNLIIKKITSKLQEISHKNATLAI